MRSISSIPAATLAGAAMAVSFFLTWLRTQVGPVGLSASPSRVLDRGPLLEVVQSDTVLLAFLATFALGALVALSGLLFRRVGRLLVLLTGAAPIALLVWQSDRVIEAIPGLRWPSWDEVSIEFVQAVWGQVQPYLGAGAYAYAGGALVLLLLALFSPAQRDMLA